MDFIIENYVWLSVLGVVLVMALIGFIAEKTDFGRKPRTVKVKEKEIEKKIEAPVVEEVVTAPVMPTAVVENTMPSVDELLDGNDEQVILEDNNTISTLESTIENVVDNDIVDLEPVETITEEPSAIEEIVPETSLEGIKEVETETPLEVIEEIDQVEEIVPEVVEEVSNEPLISEALPELNDLKDDNAILEENIWKI